MSMHSLIMLLSVIGNAISIQLNKQESWVIKSLVGLYHYANNSKFSMITGSHGELLDLRSALHL